MSDRHEECDLLRIAAESRQRDFVESFKNYGMLLNTLSPEEFSVEIGSVFVIPKQAAIVAVLLARLVALEETLDSLEDNE